MKTKRILEAFGKGELSPIACLGDSRYIVWIMEPRADLVQVSPKFQSHPQCVAKSPHKGIIVFERIKDKKLAWCGYWMDWPEEHWKIPEDKYYNLCRDARASLEAHEQLTRWVYKEFEELVQREENE